MHNNERIYVDVHVLQTVPPSCVNRDDTGSPKTAVYGGVTRARVSSQAWKHAMRLKFREMLSAGDVGQRTKLVFDLIAGKILELQPDLSENKAQQLAQKIRKSSKRGRCLSSAPVRSRRWRRSRCSRRTVSSTKRPAKRLSRRSRRWTWRSSDAWLPTIRV